MAKGNANDREGRLIGFLTKSLMIFFKIRSGVTFLETSTVITPTPLNVNSFYRIYT